MVVGIAGNTNGGASIGADSSDFAALKANSDLPDLLANLLLGNNSSKSASATAEDSTLAGGGANGVDLSSEGNHAHRETIAAEGSLCGKHTGIHNTTHAPQKLSRDTGAEALNDVSSTHAIGSQDITLLSRLLACEEGQVGAAVGVVLDAVDGVLAGLHALEVDGTDASSVTAAVVSHGDATGAVTSSLSMTDFGECELGQRLSFPEMVVDGAAQVSHTGCPWLVCLELETTASSARSSGGRVEGHGVCRRLTGGGGYCRCPGGGGICAAGKGLGGGAEQALGMPPGLLLP